MAIPMIYKVCFTWSQIKLTCYASIVADLTGQFRSCGEKMSVKVASNNFRAIVEARIVKNVTKVTVGVEV